MSHSAHHSPSAAVSRTALARRTSRTTWYGNQNETTGTHQPSQTHTREREWRAPGLITSAALRAEKSHTQADDVGGDHERQQQEAHGVVRRPDARRRPRRGTRRGSTRLTAGHTVRTHSTWTRSHRPPTTSEAVRARRAPAAAPGGPACTEHRRGAVRRLLVGREPRRLRGGPGSGRRLVGHGFLAESGMDRRSTVRQVRPSRGRFLGTRPTLTQCAACPYRPPRPRWPHRQPRPRPPSARALGHPADRRLVPLRQLPRRAAAVGGPPGGLPAVLLHRRPARDHRRAGPEAAARAHRCGPRPSCSRWASTRTGRRSSCRARSRRTPSSAGCSSA